MLDWGVGEYELTARELEPVAEHVVALADPARGTRLLDVACGTGNAALAAARRGARVTGLDSAERLVRVARERARERAVEDAQFVVGDAQDLPFADGTFDRVVSVFGLIFAADARRAVAEALRVLAPGGEALVSAWVPEGAIDRTVGIMARAVAAATGSARERFPWHDEAAVRDLAAGLAAGVEFEEGAVDFTAASPEAYAEAMTRHPTYLMAAGPLRAAGTHDEVAAAMLEALRDGNLEPDGFRVRSRYKVLRLRPR